LDRTFLVRRTSPNEIFTRIGIIMPEIQMNFRGWGEAQSERCNAGGRFLNLWNSHPEAKSRSVKR